MEETDCKQVNKCTTRKSHKYMKYHKGNKQDDVIKRDWVGEEATFERKVTNLFSKKGVLGLRPG